MARSLRSLLFLSKVPRTAVSDSGGALSPFFSLPQRVSPLSSSSMCSEPCALFFCRSVSETLRTPFFSFSFLRPNSFFFRAVCGSEYRVLSPEREAFSPLFLGLPCSFPPLNRSRAVPAMSRTLLGMFYFFSSERTTTPPTPARMRQAPFFFFFCRTSPPVLSFPPFPPAYDPSRLFQGGNDKGSPHPFYETFALFLFSSQLEPGVFLSLRRYEEFESLLFLST